MLNFVCFREEVAQALAAQEALAHDGQAWEELVTKLRQRLSDNQNSVTKQPPIAVSQVTEDASSGEQNDEKVAALEKEKLELERQVAHLQASAAASKDELAKLAENDLPGKQNDEKVAALEKEKLELERQVAHLQASAAASKDELAKVRIELKNQSETEQIKPNGTQVDGGQCSDCLETKQLLEKLETEKREVESELKKKEAYVKRMLKRKVLLILTSINLLVFLLFFYPQQEQLERQNKYMDNLVLKYKEKLQQQS